MLSKLLIFLIGEALCFPNALAQNQRLTMQQLQNELQNELQKLQNDIPVFHFPKRQAKPRLAAIENQMPNNKQATYSREAATTFNTAGYKPIETVLNKNEFFNLYQQMFQEEW